MSTQLHDENARVGEKETFRKWKDFRMMPVLILTCIFLVGFGVGYTARAMRSRKRKQHPSTLRAIWRPPTAMAVHASATGILRICNRRECESLGRAMSVWTNINGRVGEQRGNHVRLG